MKPFLTIFFSCAVFNVWAQPIYYNNETRSYVSYDSVNCTIRHAVENPVVRTGSSVSYWLVNINPFAQKIDINGRMISLTTNMPDQFVALFNIKVEAEKALEETQTQVDKMKDVNRSTAVNSSLDTTTNQLVADCNIYYEEAKNIKEALALHERLTKTMADKSFYNAPTMTQALALRHVDAAAIASLRTDFDKFEQAYDTVYAQYGTAIHAARTVGDKDKEARIASAQNQVQKSYEVLENQYEKTLASIDDLYDKATSPCSYVVKSGSIKLAGNGENADEVEFSGKVGEQHFIDTLPINGGWKIDYSVGPVFNFIANHQYFKGEGDTLTRVKEGAFFKNLVPTVAAMMHVARRVHKNCAFGGVFGINAGFKELTDINLGFLAGFSAIVGRSQKAIVSTGVSYLKVNRLKGQYTAGKPYPEVNIEDVTESVLRPSWFIAVSLNLGKRNIVKPSL